MRMQRGRADDWQLSEGTELLGTLRPFNGVLSSREA
jgi:hypothetical protein